MANINYRPIEFPRIPENLPADFRSYLARRDQIIDDQLSGMFRIVAGGFGDSITIGGNVKFIGNQTVTGSQILEGNLLADVSIPLTFGFVFSEASGANDNIVWTTGKITYKNLSYTIVAEETGDSNRFIYWDKASTPTVLHTTDSFATALGADKYIICINSGGTPYPCSTGQANYLAADGSIDTDALAAAAVATANIVDDAIVAAKIAVNGLDGTSGDVTADHITANMLKTDCVTAVKIITGAVTTAKIDALAVTAAEIAANAVETSKLHADAVTAAELNVAGIDGTSGRIVVSVGDAVDANAVTAGINAQATTLIAAGKVVITGSKTVADIAGSGVNIAFAERSIFSSATPLATVTNGSGEMSDAQAELGTYSLKLTATDVSNYVYLGVDSVDYNIKIAPNKKWIFSCWVRSSVDGVNKVRFYIKASDATLYPFQHNVASADTWERVSGVFDLSANASENAALVLSNEGGNGETCFFDGIMLEEQIGDNTTPSPFVFPAGSISIDYVPDGSSYIKAPIAWQKTGKTTIDGGQIETDSIIAGAINVDNLAAISAAMGSITSGDIILSLGGDTRLRINSSGLYVSNNAGNDWTGVIRNDAGTVKMFADVLKAGEIITAKIADNATSYLGSAYDEDGRTLATAGTWYDLVTVPITTTNKPVKIFISYHTINYNQDVRILRDATIIWTYGYTVSDHSNFSYLFVDTSPGTGTKTYKFQAKGQSTSNATCSRVQLLVEEVKK